MFIFAKSALLHFASLICGLFSMIFWLMMLKGQTSVRPWILLSEQGQGPHGDNVLC